MAHATEWSEVVATTTAEYLKGASDTTIREHAAFRMLEKRRRIKFNQSGDEIRWQAKFSLPEVETYTGGALDFSPSDKHRQLYIDWRGYVVKDMLTEKERLMNRGAQALIDRYARVFPDLEQSLRDTFSTELYVDGLTYTDRFHGLETIFGDDSATVVGDLLARPSATYAGYSTTPGSSGAGAWSADGTAPNATLATDWPGGHGDPEYDWWSPKLWNWSSNAWGTSSTAWVDNCERVLRMAILRARLGNGKAGAPDIGILEGSLYYDFINKMSAKVHINFPHAELKELGFPDSYNFDGVGLITEFGVPASTGYLLNLDQMELLMMYDQLFTSKGPEWDIKTFSYLWALCTYGNFKYTSPKYQTKLYPYAAS